MLAPKTPMRVGLSFFFTGRRPIALPRRSSWSIRSALRQPLAAWLSSCIVTCNNGESRYQQNGRGRAAQKARARFHVAEQHPIAAGSPEQPDKQVMLQLWERLMRTTTLFAAMHAFWQPCPLPYRQHSQQNQCCGSCRTRKLIAKR